MSTQGQHNHRKKYVGLAGMGSNLHAGVMDVAWLIVDGNNLIHAAPEWSGLRGRGSSFPLVRNQLVRKLEGLAGLHCNRLTIIFDGTVAGRDQALSSGVVEVEYMGAHDSADRRIEKLIATAATPADVVVVTSDRTLRSVAAGLGAQTMRCEEFVDRISAPPEGGGRRSAGPANKARPTLGDLFKNLGR